jgi:hypothetical protein
MMRARRGEPGAQALLDYITELTEENRALRAKVEGARVR